MFPRPFVVHSIEDRDYWNRLISADATAEFLRGIISSAEAAAAIPPVIQASDFLAARRFNDRNRVDRFWQEHRRVLAMLSIRRAALGIDPNDPDDRLLDWLWSFLNQPTWVVSAHIPGHDLPRGGSAQLDLAATEMAAVMAETRELLAPWISQHSQSLADTIVYEIDRRVLAPFVEGKSDHSWNRLASNPHRNNWTGVCAGSILAACVSLERQGHPRPDAKARAIQLLNIFLREGVTLSGECDEGVSYWNYGVGFACVGLQCLSPDELASQVDMPRLKQVAGYPGRAHLWGSVFYAGNDSGTRAPCHLDFIPWLAQATGDAFLRRWMAINPHPFSRDTLTLLRTLDRLADAHALRDESVLATPRTQYLDDQQVAIVRKETGGRRLLVALAGGHNGERHNHNDLGHFIAAVDEQMLIPDIGAPFYVANFFGPQRYTYLPASSRGHCCPIINGQEQRAAGDAACEVVQRDLTAGRATFTLDATAAYPPEAGLTRWSRTLTEDASGFTIQDDYQLSAKGSITHVIWFTAEPQAAEGTITAGPLRVQLSPAPRSLRIIPVDPAEHRLRDYTTAQTLYRAEADYDVAAQLTLQTRLVPA
jgi:hypothetical protein